MKILEPFDKENLIETIQKYILGKDSSSLRTLIASLHPVDAASMTMSLTKKEQQELFELLTVAEAADVIEVMDTEHQVASIQDMDVETASKIVEEMAPDEAADVLAGIPEEKSKDILAHMKPEDASEARFLLSYPEDSAGALMSTESVAFQEEMSIQETIQAVRSSVIAQETHKYNYVFVADTSRKLVGILQLKELVTKNPQLKIKDIMQTDFIQINVFTKRKEVARIFRQYNIQALPVVDYNGTLLGIITADDAADLIHEVATEDMLKLEGISVDESREMPWWKISRKRVSWLSLNIILNIIAASVIAMYQDTLQAAIAIAVFLPIISDMSGCSGMQAVAVSIRDLALEKIAPKDFMRVLGKELIVGFSNGLILGLQIGLAAFIWKGIPVLGAIVMVALWLNTILAVCIGGVTPLLLKKLKIDPAIASGPILTTMTDIMGFAIILGLATKFLPYLV